MVRLTTYPHYLALRPYLRAFSGVVGLVVVWTEAVSRSW